MIRLLNPLVAHSVNLTLFSTGSATDEAHFTDPIFTEFVIMELKLPAHDPEFLKIILVRYIYRNMCFRV